MWEESLRGDWNRNVSFLHLNKKQLTSSSVSAILHLTLQRVKALKIKVLKIKALKNKKLKNKEDV